MITRDHPTVGLVVPDAKAEGERPALTGGARVSFEAHRTLVPKLEATQRMLDDAEMVDALELGLNLQIADLLTKIGDSAGAARDVHQGHLVAKYRQLDIVRGWRAAKTELPRP